MLRLIALSVGVLALTGPAWAVNKCTGPDGKTVFQDAPCTGKGEKIEVRPASGNVSQPAAPVATPVAPAPVQPAAPPIQPTLTAPAPSKSALEMQADQCLAWYKPLLRDPANAYYTEPKFEDKRVLRMTLHATNGLGGFVTRQAACEFDNGKFSVDWTKIQAKRLEWGVN
ncbi:DUF4124 domain-containing protein [Acidovorax sp. HMWF018]|uniref:DUF4124 domain-containing protein n=1 Tax=Acidovorax sp. HMWF018 TaxID=2056855 RepID=UPI0018EE54A8|nr:DUF4124 domain-containing protein [Acidovorax sp. HMWF018]